MGQSSCAFQSEITKTVKFDYLIYRPDGYDREDDAKWPLLLYLHGSGERGSNIELLKKNGMPKVLEDKTDLPLVVVSPQCPENSWWILQLQDLKVFIDNITEQYRIDKTRIYLTGLSMGGYGTWHLAMAYPDKFAAIAPICGGGMSWNAGVLKDLPVWAFHGARDTIVPLIESENMVNALKKCGGNVNFTVYPEAEHDSWTETYHNPKLYEWFASHSNGSR